MPQVTPNAGRIKKALCISCARNKHKNCDLHMNDGAFDAKDFISVRCDCFCRGRIGTQFDSLMAMAEYYANQVEEFQEETRQVRMLAARAASVADEMMEIIRTFDSRARDDEGNLMVASRREHVDRVLDEFFLQIRAVASKSEAVLALIAEDSGFTTKDLVDKMAELQEQYDDEETPTRMVFGNTVDIDDDGHPLGEDGHPLDHAGDVPDSEISVPQPMSGRLTSAELDMVKQHERAQAVIAEQRANAAAEDIGWPID